MINRNRVLLLTVLCSLFSTSSILPVHTMIYQPDTDDSYAEWLEESRQHERQPIPLPQRNTWAGEEAGAIDEYYYSPATHEKVIEFFVRLTGSERIALPILYHAEQNRVPIATAFSLVWVESKYKPYAQNQNPTTIDRGLFQLNSASFHFLNLEDFYNPEISALHGTSYLRYALNNGDEDIETALAIYNAGLRRVRNGEIPASTKVYISRIFEYQTQLISRFNRFIAQELQKMETK